MSIHSIRARRRNGRFAATCVWAGVSAMCVSSAAMAVNGVPAALIRELDPYPGGGAGEFVASLGSIWVNGNGGVGVTMLNEDAGGGSLGFHTMWGRVNSVDPFARLFEEGATNGTYTTTTIQIDAKMDNNGNAYYSATASGPNGSVDSVWKNDTLIAAADEPIAALPGFFYTFASGIGLSHDGSTMYFVGGISSSAGGSTENRGLFDQDGNVIYKGGDIIPGYTDAMRPASTPGFQIGVSANGTNLIHEVQLDSSTTTRQALTYNGAALNSNGVNMREGNVIPGTTPGNIDGEAWDNFDDWDTNEAGDFIVNGDTDGDSATDEFLYSNHAFVLREGDVISHFDSPGDLYTIVGSVDDNDLNEDGDWVVRWAVDSSSNDALILNGKLIIQEGAEIDFDNNGLLDDGATLTSFTGLDGDLAISDRDGSGNLTVYFTADIDTEGTSSTLDDREALIALSFNVVPAPGSLAVLALAGLAGRSRRRCD